MAIILGGGSALVLDGVISIGMLYTFTEYISQLFTPVQELAEQFTTLQSAIASAEKSSPCWTKAHALRQGRREEAARGAR